jgi:ribosome biogenesis protein ENP2
LADSRFANLFTDPDFEIAEDSDQFKLMAPLMKKLEAKKQKLENRMRRKQPMDEEEEEEEDMEEEKDDEEEEMN